MSTENRTVKSSTVTSTGAVLARRGWYYGIQVYGTGASGVGAVQVFDNASTNSGNSRFKATLLAAAPSVVAILSAPVYCENGIYVTITTADVTVYYSDAP